MESDSSRRRTARVLTGAGLIAVVGGSAAVLAGSSSWWGLVVVGVVAVLVGVWRMNSPASRPDSDAAALGTRFLRRIPWFILFGVAACVIGLTVGIGSLTSEPVRASFALVASGACAWFTFRLFRGWRASGGDGGA